MLFNFSFYFYNMAELENKKYEAFCREYLIDSNGAQACIRAGYSEKTADVKASQLLRIVSISERIAELRDIRGKKLELTADNVLKELWHIGTDDIKNYLDFEPTVVVSTNPVTGEVQEFGTVSIFMKESKSIDTRNIQEISIGKDGQFKFKLYPKDAALLNVGKHLGMFTDKVDLNVNTLPDFSKLSAEEKLNYLMLQKKLRG